MDPLTAGSGPRPPETLAGAGLDQPKTTQQKAADQKDADHKAAEASFDAGMKRFKINGIVKTITGPVTGRTLRQKAGEIDGFPVNLSPDVPNDDEPYDLKLDQEFTTK